MNTKQRKTKSCVLVAKPSNGKCPYCEWSSQKGSTFSMHISIKHAAEVGKEIDPYKCEFCEKKFSAQTRLDHHISNHHIIILKNCSFLGCKYQGKNNGSLISHYVRMHLPHLATECKKVGGCTGCSRKGSISNYHIGKCNKESPFADKECEDCDDN